MNKARTAFLALVAMLMTPMAANADLMTNLELRFKSGAIFDGTVVFDDSTYAMLDVDGTLSGGGYGSIDFTWTWLDSFGYTSPLDVDGNAATFEDWLMDGSVNNWANFIGVSWSIMDGMPRLVLQDVDNYHRSLNDGVDRVYRGRFTAVPEPGTLALFGLGLLGIGAAKRRKVVAA